MADEFEPRVAMQVIDIMFGTSEQVVDAYHLITTFQ